MGNKVKSAKKRHLKFFQKLPSWQVHLSKTQRFRNHEKVKFNMKAEYGEIRSFLAEKYPECRNQKIVKQKEEDL